jgi:hypothetical protein
MAGRRTTSTPLPNGPAATIRVKRVQQKTWTQNTVPPPPGAPSYQIRYTSGQTWCGDNFRLTVEAVRKTKGGRWVRIPGTTANWEFPYGGVSSREKASARKEVEYVRDRLSKRIAKTEKDLADMKLALANSENEIVVLDKVVLIRGAYGDEPGSEMIKPTRTISLDKIDVESWGLPDGPIDPRGRWATDSPPPLPEQLNRYDIKQIFEVDDSYREDE